MWSKFRLNVCNNLPQAILGAGVGCYRDSVHMKAISDGLKGELEAIAQAKGIDLSKTEASSGRGSAVPPSARYSTLQDLDAGRHTEIDMFSGALIRMGKELGIPTIVSMNPIMVDGTGMCGACRLQVGDEIKFACVDGPEFDGHLVDFDQAMKRSQMYKSEEGRAMLKLQEGDTHHGGCGHCGGDE